MESPVTRIARFGKWRNKANTIMETEEEGFGKMYMRKLDFLSYLQTVWWD